MSVVRSFEDLKCWQRARELVSLVYSVSGKGPLARDFGTKDQIQRAAVSVMNNIAEGFGRNSNREFARFLDISQSSCMEVQSMTYILEDLKYLSSNDLKSIRTKAAETKNLTRALIKYLRSNPGTVANH